MYKIIEIFKWFSKSNIIHRNKDSMYLPMYKKISTLIAEISQLSDQDIEKHFPENDGK